MRLSPVIMTNAVRQEKEETSSFIRWRAWEKSRMESIQSPKPRTHWVLWSTVPLQKMSFSVSGLELKRNHKHRIYNTVMCAASLFLRFTPVFAFKCSCWERRKCKRSLPSHFVTAFRRGGKKVVSGNASGRGPIVAESVFSAVWRLCR